MDIVLRLRELRRVSGLSQQQVAEKSGLGVRTISSFESGSRIDSMKLSQLERILRVYGVSERQFFGGEIDERFDPFEVETREDARRISESLGRLPGTLRQAMLERIRLMVDTADEVHQMTRPQPWTRAQVDDWQLLNSHN